MPIPLFSNFPLSQNLCVSRSEMSDEAKPRTLTAKQLRSPA